MGWYSFFGTLYFLNSCLKNSAMQKKPKILVFPFDLLSHYARSLVLVHSYSYSHTLLFKSSRSYNSMVHSEGWPTFHCEEFDPEWVIRCVKKFRFDWLNDA